MFSKPAIVSPGSLSKNENIEFYLHSVRVREYSGRRLGIPLSPNTATNLRDRTQQLNQLRLAVIDALSTNTYPGQLIEVQPEEAYILSRALSDALKQKLESRLSSSYKRDLQSGEGLY